MLLLIDYEVKFISNERHLALIVLNIAVFSLLKELLHTRLAEELDKRLVFRISLVCSEKEYSSFLLLSCSDEFLRFVKERCHKVLLDVVKTLHERLEFSKLLIFSSWHRARNDEWSTCIVDEHRVHLVDNGKVMLALYEVLHCCSHVVTEVVETELVVSTECDIALVCFSTSCTVRLVLVDTIYAETVELIERSHPLGVTFREVVVHCDYMYSLSCQRIEEYRKCRNESLTLSCSHLGDLTLMKNNTTDELNVIVNHIPCDLISAGNPVVLPEGIVAIDSHKVLACTQVAVELCRLDLDYRILLESACCRLHDCESLRKNIVESLLDSLVDSLHKLI